jgi:hypothetical protein
MLDISDILYIDGNIKTYDVTVRDRYYFTISFKNGKKLDFHYQCEGDAIVYVNWIMNQWLIANDGNGIEYSG